MRKIFLAAGLVVVLLAFGAMGSLAQTTTDQSAVQIFFVACENQAVMNFTGSMHTGYDIFYQVFSGAGGTGTALTSQRQVQVDGAYAFSETIPYNGATVAAGATASVRVIVGREGNVNSSLLDTTVDDIQDGCNNPQNPVGTSVDVGAGSAASTTTSASGGVLSPFGGTVGLPGAAPAATPEPLVVIGARVPFDEVGRSSTAGLIFAECNQFMARSNPGLLYDTDNIIIFWSWYAKTPELVQDHIDAAGYAVGLNQVGLPLVQVSEIQQRGRDYWVFYTARVGHLEPGFYRVDMNLVWGKPISDGYDEFGPGTATPVVNGNCTFEIKPNPYGERINDEYNRLFRPQ